MRAAPPAAGPPAEPVWAYVWTTLEGSCAILEQFLAPFRILLGPLGAVLTPLGGSSGCLGGLGGVLGGLGALLGRLGAVLGRSRAVWERSWAVWEPSWSRLGAVWRPSWEGLGPSWGHVGFFHGFGSAPGGYLWPSKAAQLQSRSPLEAILVCRGREATLVETHWFFNVLCLPAVCCGAH